MSFLDHLEELRKRLIVSIIAIFVAASSLCWNFADRIFGWIQAPLTEFLPPGDQKLAYTRLTEPFFLYMKVAFFAGHLRRLADHHAAALAASSRPASTSASGAMPRRSSSSPRSSSSCGGYFGYRVLLPGTCEFFVETGKQFKQMIKVDEYFSFASTIILASGLRLRDADPDLLPGPPRHRHAARS